MPLGVVMVAGNIGAQVSVADGRMTVTLTLLSPLEPPALEQFRVNIVV